MINASQPALNEPPKLASALTILACAFTLFAAALVLVGFGPAILFAVIWAVAFAAWILANDPTENPNSNILSIYLLIPPVVLALNAARYSGGWVQLLETHQTEWFNAEFIFTDANWFVLLVCTSITIILVGGYLISTHMPAGRFAAW